MREDDAILVDLRRHPAGALVCRHQPDVVPPSPPLPVRVVLLDPVLQVQDHVEAVHRASEGWEQEANGNDMSK